MTPLQGSLAVLASYLAVGALIAIVFVTVGLRRVDPKAAEGTRGFKLLILPGIAALWPIMLARLVTGRPANEAAAAAPTELTAGTRPHRAAHPLIWICVGVVVAAVLVLAWPNDPTRPGPDADASAADPQRDGATP